MSGTGARMDGGAHWSTSSTEYEVESFETGNTSSLSNEVSSEASVEEHVGKEGYSSSSSELWGTLPGELEEENGTSFVTGFKNAMMAAFTGTHMQLAAPPKEVAMKQPAVAGALALAAVHALGGATPAVKHGLREVPVGYAGLKAVKRRRKAERKRNREWWGLVWDFAMVAACAPMGALVRIAARYLTTDVAGITR